MNRHRREAPLRVWWYSGWCWVCRRCKTFGHDHETWREAFDAADGHCRRQAGELVAALARDLEDRRFRP